MFAATLRRNVLLNAVGEEDNPDFIVVLNGRESQGCGNLSHKVFLHLTLRTEVERPRDVDEQHNRELAFLFENFHVGTVKTCRNVPVDVADVVAILILAHLRERHSAPFERRMVLAGEDVLTQSAAFNLYFPDLFN